MLALIKAFKDAIMHIDKHETARDIGHSITRPGEEKPNFNFVEHPLKPTDFWANKEGIKHTNKWYQNLVIGNGELPVCLYPYQFKALKNGFDLCYPTLVSAHPGFSQVLICGIRFAYTI